MKRLISIITVLALSITLLASCGNNGDNSAATATPTQSQTEDTADKSQESAAVASTDPLDMITEGYYVYSFNAPGHGDFVQFFRFYPEAPVLGSVFYAGFTNNSSLFAGTYTVEPMEYSYRCAVDRDNSVAENFVDGVAPYTITFYDFNGNVLDACGFDGSILYNDMTVISAMGSSRVMYHHDTDGPASKFAGTFAGEMGVTYLSFVVEDDPIGVVNLLHNQTYMDMVGMLIEGIWTMEAGAGGGFNYNLIPEFDIDTPAVLAVSADTLTAVYTPEGGSPIKMVNVSSMEAQVEHIFTGEAHIAAYDTDAPLTLSLYDDGTVILDMVLFNNNVTVDTGNYTMVNDYTFGISFDNAGDLQTEIDFGTFVITLDYKSEMDQIGSIEAILTLGSAEADSGGADELFSFDSGEGSSTTLTLYGDGTYRFGFDAYGVEEFGTWIFESYNLTLIQENGNEIVSNIGEGHSMIIGYVAVVSDQLADTFTAPAELWGGALVN
ncbi:MAG: hypothetical protein FWG36_03280 [Oscillospiraceae bacterium]|nr:hypothetical protein [Oscillospiraceae bacterium]